MDVVVGTLSAAFGAALGTKGMRANNGNWVAMVVVAASLAAALSPAAHAGRRAYSPGGYDGDGFTVAESRHGNGKVSGPVRLGRDGYEVRLPGGTWIGCRRSCSETLRVETVDLWENDGRNVGAGTLQNECGIFGCLDFRFPR